MQSLVTYLIVAIALAYALWLFAPVAARRWLTARLARFAPPALRTRLERAQARSASTGCSSCQGCETDAKAASAVKPIRLHRS
jgi:hypothetical protein